jgi:hypothetical protein
LSDAASPALTTALGTYVSGPLQVALQPTTHTPVRVTVVPTNDSCVEKLPEFERNVAVKRLVDEGLVE